MKKLRIFSMVVFVIAAASFGYFKYEQINSKDNQAPVITMDTDSIQVSCQAEDGELLKGIKATDSKDGDVTGSLIVESVSNFMEERVGIYNFSLLSSFRSRSRFTDFSNR